MKDLLAQFVPKFLAAAYTRVDRAIAIVEQRDLDAVVEIVRELHGVAGEAGLLGLTAIVPLARDGEDKAKQLRTSRSDGDLEALRAALIELRLALELVTSGT